MSTIGYILQITLPTLALGAQDSRLLGFSASRATAGRGFSVT